MGFESEERRGETVNDIVVLILSMGLKGNH